MSLGRQLGIRRAFVAGLLAVVVVFTAFWYGLPYWRELHAPLGPPNVALEPQIHPLGASELRDLVRREYAVVRNVRDIPRPVRDYFVEKNSPRLLMANPGENFNATDVIYDASVPRKRLIFAGVSGNTIFVHYEQGGIAHMFLVVFFTVDSPTKATPVWRGYVGGVARDVEDLRHKIESTDEPCGTSANNC